MMSPKETGRVGVTDIKANLEHQLPKESGRYSRKGDSDNSLI